MKILVLAADAVDADEVRDALRAEDDLADAEVLVVAPAVNESPLAFWMSDSDEAIEEAKTAARQTAQAIEPDVAAVHSDTGESDPLQALEDALATFPAEQVVIFARGGDGARYREETLLTEARERIDVPVRQVVLDA